MNESSGPDPTRDRRSGPRSFGPSAGKAQREDRPRPDRQPPDRQPGERRSPAQRAWSDIDSDRTTVFPAGAFGPPAGAQRPPAQPPNQGPQPPRGAFPPDAQGPFLPDPRGAVPPGAGPTRNSPPSTGAPPPAARRPVGYPAPRHGRHRKSAGIVAGRIIAAILSAAVLAGFAFAWVFANKATTAVAESNGVNDAGEAGVVLRSGVNILLVGSDARTDQQGNPLSAAELAAVSTQDDGGGVNTDTIMVVHVPAGGARATAVSLPRDTWIPQSVSDQVKGPYPDGSQGTYKPNKVNAFYGTAKAYTEQHLVKTISDKPARERVSNEAGRTMLIKIVQAFSGLKIDHYAEVNLIGFYQLSVALGGVPVCLNTAVKDPFSGADFKAGRQEISGKAAMAFVRQRHGLPAGDLDRVRRQQAFLAGATSKMLSVGTLSSPGKLNSLLAAADNSLVLDKSFDLLTFASQMANLSGGNVTFATIPTHGAQGGIGADALATDPPEIKKFFADVNGKATASPGSSSAGPVAGGPGVTVDQAAINRATVTVDVLNATTTAKMAASVSDQLVGAGFARGQVTDFPGVGPGNQHPTTTIGYPAGAKDAALAVQQALGGKGRLIEDTSLGKGHVAIVVGQDMPAPGSGLRGPGLVGLPGPSAAPAAAAAPNSAASTSINAAAPGCVN